MVAVAQPKISDADLAANYGWSLAVLNSDPSLKALFQTAVKKQYSPERFIAEVKNTHWFRNTSEAQQKYQVIRLSEPAKYVQQVTQLMASLADQWGSMTGQHLTFTAPKLQNYKQKVSGAKTASEFTKVVNGKGFLFNVADMALKMGWNEAQVRDKLATSFNWSKAIKASTLGGSASGQLQNWRAQAHALGVDPTDDWYAGRLKTVNRGDDTDEGVLAKLKELSKQRYSAFADQIDAGQSMDDLTQNYRESIGKVLEIPPNQVDVFDKNVQKAITAKDSNGNAAPMSIGDFEDELRKDDRWKFTQNAHDAIGGMGMNLLRSWGLAA